VIAVSAKNTALRTFRIHQATFALLPQSQTLSIPTVRAQKWRAFSCAVGAAYWLL
jgi:hypothetical protein